MRFFKLIVLFCGVCSASVSLAAQSLDSWLLYLDALKAQMLERGIDQDVWQKVYGQNTYYHAKEANVLKKSKKQTEFVLNSEEYLKRLLTPNRVEKTRKKYAEMKQKYADIEKKYKVPLSFLVAFWSVETNFGENKGKFLLADSLTNLSADSHRSLFFKNELYYFLKIVQDHHLDPQKLYGSWAGAMGHFQFMPSTYMAYAVDWDGDGFADIWNSEPDAIASAANYLHQIGFKFDKPWGAVVSLPWDFNYHLTGLNHTETVKQWKKQDVCLKNGAKLPFEETLQGSVIVPDSYRGQSYLVFSNFKKIMIWNRAQNYALAVSLLSDTVKSDKPFHFEQAEDQFKPTTKDIEFVQNFANRFLKTDLKVDGKLGAKTRKAIQKLQKQMHLPADGYPYYRFIQKLKSHDLEKGFHLPKPRRKVKK